MSLEVIQIREEKYINTFDDNNRKKKIARLAWLSG